MNIETAIERYLRHHRIARRSPSTIAVHYYSLRQFTAFLRGRGHSLDIADLESEDALAWVEHLQGKYTSEHTIIVKTRSVLAFGHWLQLDELLPQHPFRKVPQPKDGPRTREALTPEQATALLHGCNRATHKGARDFALLLLLFSTGLRLGEALALEQGDIDRRRQLINVRRGKGGKGRYVPLSRPVERAIDKYLAHPKRPEHARLWLNNRVPAGPLTMVGAQCMIRERGRALGIKAHAHLLRHGCAVTYLRNGGTLETLKEMYGHSTLEMSLWYAKLADADVVNAHETADPARSLKVRV